MPRRALAAFTPLLAALCVVPAAFAGSGSLYSGPSPRPGADTLAP